MPLACDYDDVCIDYWANPADDFSIAQHNCKCQSCHKQIKAGETVLAFECYRNPDEDSDNPQEIEAWERGNYFYLPDEFLCETCGEIYLNLQEAGFWLCISDNQQANLREYQAMTGFDPEKYKGIYEQDNQIHKRKA